MTEREEGSIDLSKLFDDGLAIYTKLDGSSEPTNSTLYQKEVNRGIKILEDATELVNNLSLFSSNELFDEISSMNLKYLLLPSILGLMTGKLVKKDERLRIVTLSEIYFKDFIKRIKSYEVPGVEISDCVFDEDTGSEFDSKPGLEVMARSREEKLRQYRKRKELEEKLSKLNDAVKGQGVEDELLRDYYLTLITKFVNVAISELKSIKMEKEILNHMSTGGKSVESNSMSQKPKPLKPVIITRNELQKKVFGMGYPSISTVTIEDFINQKFEEGSLSVANPAYTNSLQSWAGDPEKKEEVWEQEDAEKEEQLDKDNPDLIRNARDTDEWKDDHRRGWGNRKNMG